MLSLALSRRRSLVLVAAALGVALTARLGAWQLDRAQQKLDLQARIQSRIELPPLAPAQLAREEAGAEAQHYRRIVLRGRWVAERTVYLDNRPLNERQGFVVVTPLLLAGGDAVLVQRGWMPRDFIDRTRLAPLRAPAGEVQLTGRIAPPPSQLLALGAEQRGVIRQNLVLADFAAETGLRLLPLSVQQAEPAQTVPPHGQVDSGGSAEPVPGVDDGLLRQWPTAAVGVGKHHAYAFQWFALCALIVGLTAWFQFIRPRRLTRRTPP